MTAASTKWSYRTVDVVAIATLGVAFGVVFWGWGKLYAAPQVAGVLVWPPTAGLWGGGWLIAGIVGITDVAALIALFAVNASMILFGWLMETGSRPGKDATLPPSWRCSSAIAAMTSVSISSCRSHRMGDGRGR